MEEIKRSDIISDDALKAPLDLAKNLEAVVKQLDNIIKKGKSIGGAISGAQSSTQLASSNKELTSSYSELDKIQKQIIATSAKIDDEYAKQANLLKTLKQAAKEKTDLGDKDAKSVDRQTASIKQLEAALQANRNRYKDLNTEQARSSKEGQALLKTITEQDKAVKELSDKIGIHKEHVGDYANQIKLLNPELGEATEKVIGFGEQLAKIIISPIGLFLATLAGAALLVKESFSAFFETTEEGEETLEHFKGGLLGVKGVITQTLAELGKQLVDNSTNFSKFTKTIFLSNPIVAALIAQVAILSKLFPDLTAKIIEGYKKGNALSHERHELDLLEIKDIIDKATAERDANELLSKARDKANYNDAQRIVFAKAAKQIRLDELGIQQHLVEEEIKLQEKLIALHTKSPVVEEQKQLNELRAKAIDLQTTFYEETRRGDQLIATLEVEREKRLRTNLESEATAARAAKKAEYETGAKINQDILANEDETLQHKEAALTQFTAIQNEILKKARDQQIQDAISAAKDRAIAENPTLANNTVGLNTALEADKTLASERLKIQGQFETASEANASNYFKVLKQIYIKANEQIVEEAKLQMSTNLDILNREYNDGAISTKEYEERKRTILVKGNVDLIGEQLKFIKDKLAYLNYEGEESLALEKKYAELEVLLEQSKADKKLDIEKRRIALTIQLEEQLVNTISSLANSYTQAQVAQIDERLKTTQDFYNTEIGLAGDNQKAKDKLAKQEQVKEKEIQKEKNDILKKNAILQKVLGATQIIINTAAAVMKTEAELGVLAATPLIPLIEGIGALQLAAVLAAPIPQFAVGTDNAPGGLAVVGEKGTEMFVTPAGGLGFTPNAPTLMDVEKGTQIFPHEDTIRMLALSGLNQSDIAGTSADSFVSKQMLEKMDSLKQAVVANKPQATSLIRQGMVLLEANEQQKGFIKLVRAISLGKWIDK